MEKSTKNAPSLFECIRYLLKTEPQAKLIGDMKFDRPVGKLCYDSKKAENGDLFFCKGRDFKPEYLQIAAKKGIALAVCPKSMPIPALSAHKAPLIITVPDARRSMAQLSAFYYGFPFEKLTVIAITGTKGKTTTAQMIKNVLSGKKQIRAEILKDLCPDVSLTTPESPELHSAARRALENGATHLICEISSQAIKHLRAFGIRFDTACFLNFSPDHISHAEHSCIEEYFLCKASLFLSCRQAVINVSDESGKTVKAICRKNGAKTLSFAFQGDADVLFEGVIKDENGCSFSACDMETGNKSRLYLSSFGSYDAENAACAYAVGKLYGISERDIFRALATSKTAGRGETFSSEDGSIRIIVDYAHNGVSFQKLLKEVKERFTDYGITAIFGCPGGKALIRRYQLPFEAMRYADRIIICEDDSGKESFDQIAYEIISNAEQISRAFPREEQNRIMASFSVCRSREKAVENALRSALENGERRVILLLGRGTDTKMKTEKGEIDCTSDAEIAKRCIDLANKRMSISSVISRLDGKNKTKILIDLTNNQEMLSSVTEAMASFRSKNMLSALYCDGRSADLIREICYQNGMVCHVCRSSPEALLECDYCFRAGVLPVFTNGEDGYSSILHILLSASFDKAVYLTGKRGILIDGRTYVSSLSYENACLLEKNTSTFGLSPLIRALEAGATEAALLDLSFSHALPLYLSGGAVHGTVVRKAT